MIANTAACSVQIDKHTHTKTSNFDIKRQRLTRKHTHTQTEYALIHIQKERLIDGCQHCWAFPTDSVYTWDY